MLESVHADVAQKLLHLLNLNHSSAAKSVERIVSKSSFTDIASHLSGGIVRGEAREAHLFRLDQTNTGSECVLLANRASDDFLEIHFHRAEEMFRQVRAVEADRLIRVRPIIIVPVEQR